MKKFIVLTCAMIVAAVAMAKDIKTLVVTTTPQMHCANCEKKIKSNLRFEKGVKKIETNVPEQTVTITYDADKIKSEQLIKAFEKFGYKARELKPGEKVQKQESSGCKNM